MIDEALVFLKDSLNAYLLRGTEPDANPGEPPVRFLSTEQDGSIKFPTDAITLLLVNIEQENTLRAGDPYIRIMPNGTQQHINPDVRLNLYTLFVSHYSNYRSGLRALSQVIEYFQRNRIFNHQSAPKLNDKIEQLVTELVTMPFAEQNEVWGMLRVSYQLSALYKVRMVVFRDEDSTLTPEIQGIEISTRDMSE